MLLLFFRPHVYGGVAPFVRGDIRLRAINSPAISLLAQ